MNQLVPTQELRTTYEHQMTRDNTLLLSELETFIIFFHTKCLKLMRT